MLRTRILPLLVALLLIPGLAAQAQSATDIVQQMIERHEQQAQHVVDYTIETNRYTTYYKRSPDGQSYQTRTEWSGLGMLQGQTFGANAYQQDIEQLRLLLNQAEYTGQQSVEGRPAHVLRTAGDVFVEAGDHEQQEGQIGEMLLYVDTQQYVPLRIEYNVEVETNNGVRTISPAITFTDYQEVDGLLLPFATEMRMENLDAAMTPEEREEARRSLEELEQQLEEAGGMQRAIIERTVGGQIERLREALAEGTISFAIEVQNVQVNTGLDDALFTDN